MFKFHFKAAFGEERIHYPANSGLEEFPLFELDENGDVVANGKTNVYKQIQTFKDQVLLSNIVDRLKLTGETLIAPVETFGDSTILPKDLLDATHQSEKVDQFARSLSPSDLSLLQEKGFDEFFRLKLQAVQKSAKTEPTKEVKNDE